MRTVPGRNQARSNSPGGSRQGAKGCAKGARTEGAKGRANRWRSCDLLEVAAVAESRQPPLDLGLHLQPWPAVAPKALGGERSRVLCAQAERCRLGGRGEGRLGVAGHGQPDG